MNLSPGMLSIWCALGTVLGLAFFIIGLFIQRKSLRTGGILFFTLSFAGLLYLIANHGQVKKEVATVVSGQEIPNKGRLLLSYESVVTKAGDVIGIQDKLQALPHPLHVVLGNDSLFLMHGKRVILSRGMRIGSNEIELRTIVSDPTNSILSGLYLIKDISNTEWKWTTEYIDDYDLKHFDDIILTAPRLRGQ
jgi:hypothetical protein